MAPPPNSATPDNRPGKAALGLLCLLATACATEHGNPHPAPDTAQATAPLPAGPVTLTGWPLTLPMAGRKGDAAIVDPAAASPPWLTTGPDHNHPLGTGHRHHPPNSTHTRTELDNHTSFPAATAHHLSPRPSPSPNSPPKGLM